MNFAELLSLAKQNDHRAKAEIKSSKGPVTEFTTPGREIKVKPDLKKIESRLKEHQQRVEQAKRTDNSSAAKLPQGSRPAIQNGAAAGKPSAISSKSPSAPAQNGNKVPPSSTQSNPRGPMRPVGGSKPSIPASSAGQNGSRAASGTNQAAQSTNQSTNKSTYQSTNQSTNQSKLAVGQPRPVTNPPPKPGLNSARPNNRPPVLPARATPATSKPRPLLAPPQSFSALLQMASVQQADPSKSFAPPPPSVPRQIPNVASTSRREEMRPNNGHNRNGPTSYPKNPRERSYQQTEPPRPSTKNASDSYDINPGYSNPSVPKGVKKRAHLLAKPQGRQPPTISNGRTGQNSAVGNSRLSGSSSNLPRPNNPPPRGGGPSTSASAQPKMNPYPSVTARGSGAGQRSQPDPRLSQSQIRPPGGAGGLNRTAPVSGAGSAGRVAPVGRAAPGVAKRHLQQQPPPPPKPAVPRAYPNGPSFPAFRPPPRKRLRPDRYEDEDSEYDEEMDDFIDDDDVEGNPPDVSNAIREVLQGNFGYDRRKYVNRPEEDDDDLRHMEAGVHTVWREEERSAEIGRLEDEIAEEQELEEERRALKRRRDLMLMKNKGKRKARISDDEDEDDEEDDDDDE